MFFNAKASPYDTDIFFEIQQFFTTKKFFLRNLFFFSCFFVFFEKFKISYFKGKTEKKNVNVTKCTREKKTKKNAFFSVQFLGQKKKMTFYATKCTREKILVKTFINSIIN